MRSRSPRQVLCRARLPFDLLPDNIQIPRSSTYSPLFQVFMDYRQINPNIPVLLNAMADGAQSPGRNAYDVVLDITVILGSEIRISLRAQKSVYSVRAAKVLLKSYIHLIKSLHQILPRMPTDLIYMTLLMPSMR